MGKGPVGILKPMPTGPFTWKADRTAGDDGDPSPTEGPGAMQGQKEVRGSAPSGRHFKSADGDGAQDVVPPFLSHAMRDMGTAAAGRTALPPEGGATDLATSGKAYRHVTVIDSRIAIHGIPDMPADIDAGSATLDAIRTSKAEAIASIAACGEDLRLLGRHFRGAMAQASGRCGM